MQQALENIKNQIESIATNFLTEFTIANIKLNFGVKGCEVEAIIASTDGSTFRLDIDEEGEVFIDKVPF